MIMHYILKRIQSFYWLSLKSNLYLQYRYPIGKAALNLDGGFSYGLGGLSINRLTSDWYLYNHVIHTDEKAFEDDRVYELRPHIGMGLTYGRLYGGLRCMIGSQLDDDDKADISKFSFLCMLGFKLIK